MAYEFSQDWFSHNIGKWTEILDKYEPHIVLEIGSFEGRSTAFLIEYLGDKYPISLDVIDTWEGGMEHEGINFQVIEERFNNNVREAVKRAKNEIYFRKHKAKSLEALIDLSLLLDLEEHFDLIYIDGSHEAPYVLSDALLSFNLLRKDGIIIFDDYEWGKELYDPTLSPKLAIDAFLSIYQNYLEVLHKGWQVIIKKTKSL